MSRRVVLASTFVVEPVVPALSYWLERHQLDVELVKGPYGQVLEQVASTGSELTAEGTALGVLLVRLEDYLRDEDAGLCVLPDALETAQHHLEELATSLSEHAAGGGCPILIGVMPDTADERARRFVGNGRQLLAQCGEAHPTISMLDIEGALDLYSVREVADPFRDEIAHIPFSEECLTAVGTMVARQLRALWGPPCKVIALDCDNTLWRGACSEDPLEELDAAGPFEYLRTFMYEQARAGRLLCLVSRNRKSDVARAFARHGAPLTSRDVIAWRCGWDAKPDSLRSIATELDLDVGSFVFVDDDPLECASVREQLPDVAVVEIPPEPDRIPGVLRHAWELDVAAVTEADLQRRQSYAANGRLRAERRRAPSLETFLKQLEVRVSVTPMALEDGERVVQLFQRTNQFNSTGSRISERELRDHLAVPSRSVWVVRVADRLGDYGLVGALLASTDGETLRLDHVALSCRVFQRGVEHTMLKELLEMLEPRPTRALIAYKDTGRNVPVRRFLDELGAEEADGGGGGGVAWFEFS